MEAELTSNLLTLSSAWATFGWDSKKTSLEKAASTAKANNTQAQSARKLLAESTKAFKKCLKSTEVSIVTTDEQKQHFQKLSTASKGIVKSYQEEIDKLTKRCKHSDNALMELSKSMTAVNDPSMLLQNAAEHLNSMSGQVSHLLKGMEEMQVELNAQKKEHSKNSKNTHGELNQLKKLLDEANAKNKKLEQDLAAAQKASVSSQNEKSYMSKEEKEELIELRREVAEYEVEFKTLKNQDITIKKLNAKIEDLVLNQEEELQRELKKAQEHLAQTEGRRAAEALERESIMERKLASLELELKAERAGSEATQASLLEADEGLNEREAAWEAQRQILVDDADRLREQLHQVKRERDDLKIKAEALKNDDIGSKDKDIELSSMQMEDMLTERKAYEAEVSELTVSVNAMREEMKLKDDAMVTLESQMQRTVESLDNERSLLANRVSELESELAQAPSREMIEKMRRELNVLKKVEFGVDPEKEEEPEMTSADDVNELESVLISKLRKVEADLIKERREKTDQYEECDQLKKQIKTLEESKRETDLLVERLESDLNRITTSQKPKVEGNPEEFQIHQSTDPVDLEHILDPSVPPPEPASKPSPIEEEKKPDATGNEMTDILMAMKERLTAKVDKLQAERDSFKQELQQQVSVAESLKTDNTKLYEKVRYLQSYRNSTNTHVRSMDNTDLDLEALEQRYEASVDPFKQFSRNERQRKMNEMSPMERTVFFVARTVLGSKEMRTALFFYVIGMHLLVFGTTYHWSHGCSSVAAHPSHVDAMHAGLPEMEE